MYWRTYTGTSKGLTLLIVKNIGFVNVPGADANKLWKSIEAFEATRSAF